MIRKFTFLLLTVILCATSAFAIYTPVAVTGFNKDVVANGTGPVRSSAASVDDKRDTSGYSFVAQDYRSPANAAPTYYLPQNGLINSAATSGIAYQLADYSSNNSLRLDSTGNTGTISLTSPVYASDIYVLATAGGASTNFANADVVITFTDNTTVTTTLAVRDWYNYTPVAIQGIGRVAMSDGGIDNGGLASNPRLYEYKLTLAAANWSKQIQSITFTRTNATGILNVMAISVNSLNPCSAPTTQPTSLVLTPSVYAVTGSFTATVPPANKYLVLRTPGAAPVSTAPVSGATYTVGQVFGNATVISIAAATTFTDVTVATNTAYTYSVYAFSDTACSTNLPTYNTTSPLTGSVSTPACAATPAGTYSVGPTGTYPTLTAAMTALNIAAGAAGNVIVELQPTYTSATETYPIVIPNVSTGPCSIGNPTLIIRPAAGATALSITGSVANPIIDFNGARKATLDGRPGGVGTTSQLTVINDNTAGVAIRLTNDAINNTIKYCDIQGRNTSNTSGTGLSGVVYFGQANATTLGGNDYDTLANNSIHGTASGFPAIAVSAYGTNSQVSAYNDSAAIINCNIYDYFLATSASTGIKLDLGNNAWTISGNSLYQTAARTYTTAATHRGFWITPNVASITNTAGGFTITNNFIGGSAASAGGSAYTMAGSVANVFNGMDLSVGGGTSTSVQNNTIANFSLTSTSTSTAGVFVGINTANGNLNIGTQQGNTIGSGTGNGSISITNGSAGTSFGIRIGGGNVINVVGNTIGSIGVAGTTAATSVNFTGIGTGGGTTSTVSGNTIGSLTTPNSITLAASTATTAQVLSGINMANGTTISVVNNTIANLTNNHATTTATTTASQVRGIAASTGTVTINGNTIRSLTNSSIQTGSGASAAVLGISMTSTTAGSLVSGNKIYTLRSTAAAAAVNVVGMYIGAATSGTNEVSKNLINSLNAATTASGAFVTGMDLGAGALYVVNNMVRVGIDSAGNSITTPLAVRGITRGGTATASKFYFNSVYVGGTGVATTATTASYAFQRGANPSAGSDSIVNNIFVNARSNSATGGGKHYAIYLASATGAGTNFNLYFTPGTGGVFGYNGTADVATFAPAWIADDIRSISGDPKFINPTGTEATANLHINTAAPTPVETAGSPVASVTDDYDAEVRASLTPTDIGADAGNFIAQDISAPLISYSQLDYTCLTTSRTLTATITDATGVPTTGNLVPRVYYKKGNAGTWVSTAGTLVSGTATNGVWSFNINVSLLGGVVAGDQIFYYVIAQDVAATPNISGTPAAGLVATDVNTVTTQPTSPTTFAVSSGPGVITIVNTPTSSCPVKLVATGGRTNFTLAFGTQAAQNAASTTATGYPAPFSNYYGGNRQQFLVLASELTTAGFSAGSPISSINFPVVSIGSSFTTAQNFKVKITGTTNTVLPTFISNATTTTVYGPTNYTPTVGYNNQLNFTTPYIWNGTDNLVLETTFSNVNTGNANTTVFMYNSPTSFQGAVVYRADGVTAAAAEAATTVSYTYSSRPDFTLKGGVDAAYTWTPTTGLYTNAAATVAYTGGAADSLYGSPTVSTVYTVTASTPQGCGSSTTFSLSNTCALPVTLLSFTGERKASTNLLSWVTTTELNNKGFELQRSADGVNFSVLGFVASKANNGNSNANISYGFTDTKALVGNNFYRLKQIDKDGKATYSSIVLLKGEKINVLALSVLYPNPVKEKLNVIVASPKADKLTLIVSDITGKIVSRQAVTATVGDNKYEMNVQTLTSGNYIVKVICNEGCETVIGKFTKN